MQILLILQTQPRKSGKSIFFNYLHRILIMRKYGSLYLNIEALKNQNNLKDIKSIIYHELLYLIINKNEIEDLYNLRLFIDIQYNDILGYLKAFIKNLIEKYDNIL